MQALRHGLRTTTSSSSAARTAANAVANRVTPSGLEGEEWIAADVEDSVAVFSEPLTIDELTNARSSLESAIAQSQDDRRLAPAGCDERAISDASETSAADACDPDHQMQMLDNRAVRPGVQEFLDAAYIAAQNDAVKSAVISVLIQSSDARASLERAFAANGLSLNLTQLTAHGQPALPAAAAAIRSVPLEVTDITDVDEQDQKDVASRSRLDGLIDAIVGTLGELGGNVKSVLRSFVARWRRRFDRLFNPGTMNDEGDGEQSSGPAFLIDAVTATATLIIVVALARRVPLVR